MLGKISVNTQSSICIKTGKTIYFDPYKIGTEAYDADVVLITHAHPDHFSPADFQKVAKADTIFVFPASMESEALGAGISAEKMRLLKPGDKCEASGILVEAVPAYNIGKPMHPKKKRWLGYVITTENTRIYVCGDTDDIPEGKAVQCDIAMVPIGGIFTMNAKKAAMFVNEMQPKIVVPIHYGTLVGSPKDAEVFKELVKESIMVSIKL